MNVKSLGRATGAIVGGDFSDPTNERIIYLSAAGLALVGIGLLICTIVWWRRGRQEHPSLAPLEVMGGRSWVRAPEGDRRRRLDQVRTAGAGGTSNEADRDSPVDLEALVRSVPQAFDDLREPGGVIELPEVEVEVESVAESDDAAEPVAELPQVDVAELPEVEDAEVEVAEVEVAEVEVAEVEVAEVDPTSFSAERPPTDMAPVSGGSSSSSADGKKRRSRSADPAL